MKNISSPSLARTVITVAIDHFRLGEDCNRVEVLIVAIERTEREKQK